MTVDFSNCMKFIPQNFCPLSDFRIVFFHFLVMLVSKRIRQPGCLVLCFLLRMVWPRCSCWFWVFVMGTTWATRVWRWKRMRRVAMSYVSWRWRDTERWWRLSWWAAVLSRWSKSVAMASERWQSKTCQAWQQRWRWSGRWRRWRCTRNAVRGPQLADNKCEQNCENEEL